MVYKFQKSYLLYKFADKDFEYVNEPSPRYPMVVSELKEKPIIIPVPNTPKRESPKKVEESKVSASESDIYSSVFEIIKEYGLHNLTLRKIKDKLKEKYNNVSEFKETIRLAIEENQNLQGDESSSEDEVEEKPKRTKKSYDAWAPNEFKDMIEELINFVSDPKTNIDKPKTEDGIETLYYIFKAYNESKNNKKYEINDYLDYMRKIYNNPKKVYNPFIAKFVKKGNISSTATNGGDIGKIINNNYDDIHNLSKKLIEFYPDHYEIYKNNKKHIYKIKEDDEGESIVYNPYTGVLSNNSRISNKFIDNYNEAMDEEGLNLSGIKKEYYLYLSALKVVKDKNQWKKTVGQICNVGEECDSKCCDHNKCSAKKSCEKPSKKKKPKKKSKNKEIEPDLE